MIRAQSCAPHSPRSGSKRGRAFAPVAAWLMLGSALVAFAACTPRAQTSGAPLGAGKGWIAARPLPTELPARAPVAAAPPAQALPAPLGAMVELFPHVRLDAAAKAVEFDAIVPVDCHDPQTPIVYLELVCCAPDTREHESLLMTRALASHIHAALLAAGLEPGAPGLVDFRGKEITGRVPRGAGLRVELRTRDAEGVEVTARPDDWIVGLRGENFGPLPEGPGVWGREGGWVFAGSRFVNRRDMETGKVREVYDADGAGQIIGLTTFGSEMIAWRQVLSPEAGITAPAWIARRERVPRAGTPVVVRVMAE